MTAQLPSVPAADAAPAAVGAVAAAETDAAAAATPPPPPVGWWAGLLARKWLLVAGASLAGVSLLGATWLAFWASSPVDVPPSAAPEQPGEPVAEPTPTAATPPQGQMPRLDRRWLPDRTKLVVSLRPSQLAAMPGADRMIQQADQPWQQTFGAVTRVLGLKPEAVRRMTWACADLSAVGQRGVMVIELEGGQSAAALSQLGEPAGLSIAGSACRQLPKSPWPHPWAVINESTILTGHEELLQHLAARGEPRLESVPVDRLLKAMGADADVLVLVDLAAARAAHWRLPENLFDVWPAGKQAWHAVWEIPIGLGCALRSGDRLRGELALVCDGDTSADRAQAAVGELVPAAKKSLTTLAESLPEKLKSGQITVAAAGQYELLLQHGLEALDSARWDVVEGIVWLRVDWDVAPATLAAAALDSRPAAQSDWRRAARTADEANQRRLLLGLGGYQKAEGQFPAGAEGGALAPPETRLSWIAKLLPYYDHGDWHRRLQFAYPWNGAQNQPITRRALPEVINPGLGPAATEAGFPVAHYVGVSGVGEDAATLKADHPRAGVFAFGRTTRPEDIADGASNTIALLGVSGRLGAWAAGGQPTVRALKEPPYVDGPDGFGSGQPEGMLAGMADGSVRFISKDIDPRVLEQLATIRGGEGTTVAALEPRPLPGGPLGPKPPPEKPDATPVDPLADPLAKPEPPQPVAPPTEPVRVDVKARWGDPIPLVDLADMSFGRAVALLAAMGTLPVSFDPDALADLEVTLSDPVTVHLEQTTIGKALEAVAASRGMTAVVADGQVLITSPAECRETLRSRRYTVSDLSGGDQGAVQELAAMIQKLVAPETWQANGGRGTITIDGAALAVSQNDTVHRHVLTFCEKLRTARDKPLRSRLDPDRFTLATRYDRAKPVLDRTVTVNFHEPTPLSEVLAFLEELTQADILADRVALAAAGHSGHRKTTLNVEKQPLGTVLSQLLQPLGLGWRVVDAETLQVTTRKAVEARLELEFYAIRDAAAKGQAAAILQRIKTGVAPASWSDAGGPGVLYFDKPSGCLLVLQSQPVQMAVEQALTEPAGR